MCKLAHQPTRIRYDRQCLFGSELVIFRSCPRQSILAQAFSNCMLISIDSVVSCLEHSWQ